MALVDFDKIKVFEAALSCIPRIAMEIWIGTDEDVRQTIFESDIMQTMRDTPNFSCDMLNLDAERNIYLKVCDRYAFLSRRRQIHSTVARTLVSTTQFRRWRGLCRQMVNIRT